MLNTLELTEALAAIGDAELFIGDPSVADGMDHFGMAEGELRLETSWTENALVTERTGDIPHQVNLTPGRVAVVGSFVIGSEDMLTKMSPLGAKGMGHSRPQAPQEHTVLLIPRSEIGAGLSHPSGGPWSPAAPKYAVWLWRCYVTHGPIPFRLADGGKLLVECRFTAMFDGTRPEGQKVFTIGDPVTQGVAATSIIL